jgi:hypothetical protein
VAPIEALLASHTSWELLARHCRLFVAFGGLPRKNAQINAGGATVRGQSSASDVSRAWHLSRRMC